MKFSEKWLREWVDPPVTTMELVKQLTMAGLEVDSVERLDAGVEGLADVVVPLRAAAGEHQGQGKRSNPRHPGR